MREDDRSIGAFYLGGGRCRFRVWAPFAGRVDVLFPGRMHTAGRLEPSERGYHDGILGGVQPGDVYLYRLDGGEELPDPASRSQPDGVCRASQVIDPCFEWQDGAWRGRSLQDFVIYELHVGTFTPEGTFDGVLSRLDELVDLGITAIELMPVSQFPGARNWGYDGVHPFAVQNTYGGLYGLKRLVDGCHRRGVAVVLDVVCNHLGPEGNFLGRFGPYFGESCRTPWGAALNFDGPHSDEVRRFFIENILYWLRDCHMDAVRLDAVHAIMDSSATPFLEETALAVREAEAKLQRRLQVIAECNRNDPRIIRGRESGGLGLDAQWSDDFHHALHALLTGEGDGYYADFGGIGPLAGTFRDGQAYTGQYSEYRKRRHGRSTEATQYWQYVVCSQNHDQVGNRMRGERLSVLLEFEALKLAAGTVLLSPFTPMLFMGEEYGETAPFLYFVSHSDPELIEAVRKGRMKDFSAFGWREGVPDPQDEATFLRSRLCANLRRRSPNRELLAFYRELLVIRRSLPPAGRLGSGDIEVSVPCDRAVLTVHRRNDEKSALMICNFENSPAEVCCEIPAGRWSKRLDSADREWAGPGGTLPSFLETSRGAGLCLSPLSLTLFLKPSTGA